jgi:hypothetical protein
VTFQTGSDIKVARSLPNGMPPRGGGRQILLFRHHGDPEDLFLHSNEHPRMVPANKHRTTAQGHHPKSLAKTMPAAILETVLARLAPLFLTGAADDMNAAREAASQMLMAYDPRTQDELHLAANIVGFSFQALEALSQAATPGMPLTRTLRLRGGAVSLSRESHKAQRRLDKLQTVRRAGIPAETQPEPTQPEPKIEKALDLIDTTRKIAAAAKTEGLTWTQAYEQRQRDNRLAASRKRAEAGIAAQAAVAAAGALSNHPATGQAV